ncbi:MAG: NFYB/HAP3 family transcription factor subunit [Candidatus Aenigmarchaeota archaeon]|nr:NFYB/HAP3 family transcription factor subunit [Candidatus Aenigmarchaeota archaeon]
MSILPMTPFERIVKKNQIKRVSREALEEAREYIEETALEISEQSVRLANHAGRKTVRKEDIDFVTGHR